MTVIFSEMTCSVSACNSFLGIRSISVASRPALPRTVLFGTCGFELTMLLVQCSQMILIRDLMQSLGNADVGRDLQHTLPES